MKAGQTPTPSSSSSSVKSHTTPNPTPMANQQERNNHPSFPSCRRDANCECSICLDSIKSMLDLMPMSAQRTSLSKLSSSRPLILVDKTPIPIDSTLLSTPKLNPRRRTTSLLMCFILLLAAEFGGCWFGIRVLGTPRLSPSMAEKLIQEALDVDDLGEKFRALEKGLKRLELEGEILRCGIKNSTWKIDQDGLLLNTRCTIYKSAAEELAIWGWPFQTSGLLTAGSSPRSIGVISGRITEINGGIGSQVARNAGSIWMMSKWSAAALRFDPNTWVLEYTRSSLLENTSLFVVVGDFVRSVSSVLVRRVRKEFWLLYDCGGGGGASVRIARGSHIPPT